ncbi:Outer membrane protein assembly factor BamA [compost metagenome]
MATICISVLLVGGLSFAQESDSNSGRFDYSKDYISLTDSDEDPEPVTDPTEKTPLDTTIIKDKVTKGEWVVAPVPSYNPSQEWGLALIAQKIFAHKSSQKPSVLAAGLFGTEKKSYGGIVAYMGRLREDRLRLNVFGGYAKVNSDFYGIGKDQSEKDTSVLLEQKYSFLTIQFLPKWGSVYLGPSLTYLDISNRFDISGLPDTVDPSDKLDSTSYVPGLKFQMDTRDNTFYPKQGYLTNLSGQFYDSRWGGGHTFQNYRGNHNMYFHMWDENVLAARVAFQINEGDVPFYNLAVFGQGPDLRGYKAGKYRDKDLWATQAEFRQRFTDHIGVAYFAGVGDVIPSLSDLSLDDLLWAGGVGFRYRLGARNPIDFRIDVAYGDEWAWYFAVNQAF